MTFPQIDPIIVQLGPLAIRWYGLMYVLGFAATYLLVKRQIRQHNLTRLAEHFDSLNFILILSVIIGGRLGYVLFYNPVYYLEHPLEIIATWSGGMSFHGACIGLLMGSVWFCRKKQLPYLQTADVYIVTIPIGLGLGRIGNFINGELYGRITDVPWAMVFPYGGPFPRHPSQLYEALLEGVFLFLLLWIAKQRVWRLQNPWPHGILVALFFIGYGFVRSFVELFREPDVQIGYVLGLLTMGQLLSSLMIMGGTAFLYLLLYRARSSSNG